MKVLCGNICIVVTVCLGISGSQVIDSIDHLTTSASRYGRVPEINRVPFGSPILTCESVCSYDDWFQRAHCNDRSLNAIPISTGCEDASLLELQNNNICQLSRDHVSTYPYVVTLDLSNNNIESIKPGLFENMMLLENLFLSRNNITGLRNRTFIGTEHQLLRLFVDNNNLSDIDELALRGLCKLKTLIFSHNLIRDLPEKVFYNLTGLEYLHLTGNKLTILKENIFRSLLQLRSISLDHNFLHSLPSGLFRELRYLQSIDLSHNWLMSIPEPSTLGISNSLTLLNLYNNNFNSSVCITPYLERSDLIVIIGSNPIECDCSFKEMQDWFLSKPLEKQHIISDRSPLECRWNGSLFHIRDDLSPTCQPPTEGTNWFRSVTPLSRVSSHVTVSSQRPMRPNTTRRQKTNSAATTSSVKTTDTQYQMHTSSVSFESFNWIFFGLLVVIILLQIINTLMTIYSIKKITYISNRVENGCK